MSSAYPEPPGPSQQHYNALYPTSEGASELDAPMQQEQLQYSHLNQPIYPKAGSHPHEQAPANGQMHNLAEELRQHVALEDQQHQQFQHATQQMQQNAPQPQGMTGLAASQVPVAPGSGDQSQKPNRLRKACDSCSIRKVKCDESGPPCRACAALDIPCTFERPSRRRGPPNRHAEAVKRRRLDGDASPLSSPSSPTHAAEALTALSSYTSDQHLSAESICAVEALDSLIDDFFIYIHPSRPFPHEPSFREAWKRREDLSNKSFLALLASMIGALGASLPRKPGMRSNAQKRRGPFPDRTSLVKRCHQVCAMARGPGYLESETLSVYDAATSYFLGLAGTHTSRLRLGRLYFGECLTILRALGLHKSKGQPHTQFETISAAVGYSEAALEGLQNQNVDNITLEIGRRVFWTMFVSVKTIQQLGASFGEMIIPPPTISDPYPPLPIETDDFCIYPSHNEPQPPGLLPIIAGFNANVKIYCSYNALTTMETAWGIDAVVDWERQKRVLSESLRRCKQSILDLPPELLVYRDFGPFAPQTQQNGNALLSGFTQPNTMRDPTQSLLTPLHRVEADQTPEELRYTQYEIQKANIYASSLSTRFYIVEKFFTLCEAHDGSKSRADSLPDSSSVAITAAGLDGILPQPANDGYDVVMDEMQQEREEIVKDLLVVLGSISQDTTEPNANSFMTKIRSIVSTLLDAPNHRKAQLAIQTQEYLAACAKVLMKLNRVTVDQPEDEEFELRQWAALRDLQEKFMKRGGVVGLS